MQTTRRNRRAWLPIGIVLSCSLSAATASAEPYSRADRDARYERQYDYRYNRGYANPEQDRYRAANIYAQNDDWNSLSADEQRALSAHRRSWNSYPPQQRARLKQGVQRYYKLTPQQRDEVQRGHQRYERMSPQERERARERYQRSQGRDE